MNASDDAHKASSNSMSKIALAALAAMVLVAAAMVGFLVTSSGGGDGAAQSSETTAPSNDTTVDDEPAADGEPEAIALADEQDADAAEDVEADTDSAEEPVADDETVEEEVFDPSTSEFFNPIGPDSPASPEGTTGSHSILSGGRLYVRGPMNSEELASRAIGTVELVMGQGNVISEYTYDPTFVYDPGAPSPVFIADTVQFQTGSAEIAPDFYPLIELGIPLMAIQPSVTIEVLGYTDSDGSDEANLALSQARVNAVRDHVVENGADPARIIATGFGEANPIADNETAEGRQANRRVEFIINGFALQ